MDLSPGTTFPDIAFTDHAGNARQLSEAAGGDPLVLQFFRGWWCPKEQRFLRRLAELQDEAEVAYTRPSTRRRSTRRSAPASAPAGSSARTPSVSRSDS